MMGAELNIEALYRSHGDLVLRRARALMRNEAAAQDILQDVFASLCENPNRFRKESSPSTFLYAATTHRALRRMRDSKNRQRLLDEKVTPYTAQNYSPRSEDWTMIRNLLAQLPDKLAHVAVYRYLDGMSRDEIGAQLKCSGRHVTSLLAKFHKQANKIIAHNQQPETSKGAA